MKVVFISLDGKLEENFINFPGNIPPRFYKKAVLVGPLNWDILDENVNLDCVQSKETVYELEDTKPNLAVYKELRSGR